MRRAVVIVLGLFAAGCATEPPIGDLPAAASGGASAVAVPGIVGGISVDDVGEPIPVDEGFPTDPVGFFRARYDDCSRHAALLSRGAEGFPRVEEDRFTGAVLVRELDRDTALIEDGRGTRLVVDQWRTMGTVLPESGRPDDPMPEPYRLACPPDLFVGAGG